MFDNSSGPSAEAELLWPQKNDEVELYKIVVSVGQND